MIYRDYVDISVAVATPKVLFIDVTRRSREIDRSCSLGLGRAGPSKCGEDELHGHRTNDQ